MARLVVKAGLLATPAGACEGTADKGEGGCDRELREVSLDAKFGDETPRQVIELLERPVTGIVTWPGAESDYVDISGASGTSTFRAQAAAGPTVWVLEGIEGQGGIVEGRIFCPTDFVFDVAVHFESEDGALNEDWRGRGTYEVSGTLGANGIEVHIEDPRPFGGTLQVTERPAATEQWDTRELGIRLAFVTWPLDFVGLNGEIVYNFENASDGEIVGVRTTIADFSWPQ